jgi:hypothetical protein
MKRIISIILSFIVLLSVTCKRPEVSKIFSFDISKVSGNDIKLNLSDYADDIIYIEPEYKSDSIPSTYLSVKIIDGKILIHEYLGRLFVYNLDGQLLTGVFNKGRGPGEYLQILDFTLINDEIYILDNARKILKFNLKGEFISEFRLPGDFLRIADFYGELLAYTMPPLAAENGWHKLALFDTQFNIKSRAYPTSKAKSLKLGTHSFNSLYMLDGCFSLWEADNDTIFRIDRNLEMHPRISINYGGKPDFDDAFATNNFKNLTPFHLIETTKFLFIDCMFENHMKTIFYDRNQGTGGNVIFHYPTIDQGFHNDIDGGYPFWPKGITDDGELFTWFDPVTFKEKFKNDYFRNLKVKNLQKAEKIKESILSSGEKTNPIIMVCRFR